MLKTIMEVIMTLCLIVMAVSIIFFYQTRIGGIIVIISIIISFIAYFISDYLEDKEEES